MIAVYIFDCSVSNTAATKAWLKAYHVAGNIQSCTHSLLTKDPFGFLLYGVAEKKLTHFCTPYNFVKY